MSRAAVLFAALLIVGAPRAAVAANGSQFVSQSVPPSLAVGQHATVSVTMRNSGTTTWTPAGEYKLGSQNPMDNFRWGTNRIYLDDGEVVPPGAEKTFRFDITAPATAGTYNFQWRMVQDGVEWFGAFSSNVAITVTSTPTAANGAQFVAQSVPGSLAVGQTATVSVTMRNSGTTTWTPAGLYRLGAQNPQDNLRWGSNRIYLAAGDSIGPGQSKAFSFPITAPATAGTYNFQWRMVQDGVEWFGGFSSNLAITVTSAPTTSNGAQFVAQSVPGSLATGQTATVSVTMRNSGTTTWTRAGGYRLGSQNPQDNSTWGLGRVELGDQSIGPGQSVTFGFTIRAPATAGTYNFQWRMVQELVEWFGAPTTNVAIAVTAACTAGSPNDSCPDDDALQALLDRGGTIRLTPGTPGYIIARGLVLEVDGTDLTSAQAPTKATLIAAAGLSQPMLRATSRSNFVVQHLVFDGNKASRTITCSGYRDYGSNIIVDGLGSGFAVTNVESRNTMCGSALQVRGSGFEVAHNHVHDNGFSREQSGQPEPWSDGITSGLCVDGWIHHNTVTNSTDVGVVTGGGQRCRIENNSINQPGVRGFAGINVGNFAGEGDGDQTGALIQNNTINAHINGLDFGIVVGIHPWFPAAETRNGSIINNTVSGAVVNLAIDGYRDGAVTGNVLSNPQGHFSHFKGNCAFTGNYTVGHTTGATLQTGFAAKVFHGDGCQDAATATLWPSSTIHPSARLARKRQDRAGFPTVLQVGRAQLAGQ